MTWRDAGSCGLWEKTNTEGKVLVSATWVAAPEGYELEIQADYHGEGTCYATIPRHVVRALMEIDLKPSLVVRWFGEEKRAARVLGKHTMFFKELEQVEAPAGRLCAACSDYIRADDTGVLLGDETEVIQHIECCAGLSRSLFIARGRSRSQGVVR